MEIITSAVAFGLLIINLGVSKILKEKICMQMTGKRDFRSLDVDLIVRGLFLLGLFAIEIGLGVVLEEMFFD
jgi:hypothetical protein